MGLFKKGCIASLVIVLLSSCGQTTKMAMSSNDRALLNKTIRNSLYANDSEMWISDGNMQLQSPVPKNLQRAIAAYKDQYQSKGLHDYEYLQKMAFRILENPLFEEDVEGQILALFGVDLAKHPKLFPVIERALDSPFNIVQLTAIQTLAKLPEDKANTLLVKGCGSPFLDVAFTTAFILAQRKHPQAFGLIEALMNKAPKECLCLFPSLLAHIDNPIATTKLIKCITSAESEMRLGAILAAASMQRTELLPHIRSLSKQHSILQQEACAFALGELHDEASTQTLFEISKSPSDTASLAALNALYKIGHQEAISKIESYAQKGNLFAIQLLGRCQGDTHLLEVLSHKDQMDNVTLNASIALLKKKNASALPHILALLIPENPNILIAEYPSPAMTLSAKKFVLKSSSPFGENPNLEQMSFTIRSQILSECAELPEEVFLRIASEIIDANQNDLIPSVINHLMTLKTSKALDLLKLWQQKIGSPYVRIWSNLALLKLGEPGPYKENVLNWITKEKYHRLVRIKGVTPWNKKKIPSQYEINPFETSQLMMEAYISIAEKQDEDGIQVLLNNLENNDLKNKYAIAGLLILATQ